MVSPVSRRRNGSTAPDGQRRALVLLSDPDLELCGAPGLIGDTYDLTPAEAAVAQRLLTGADVAEIAAALGISTNTVRNHLKRLFSKTNTSRHTELLHCLMRSPSSLPFRSV